jgi:hypothetical protein
MTTQTLAAPSDWLRSPGFDLGLIVGVLLLALVLGGVAAAHPALFTVVLLADLWLLAYPHVASMYTRVAFDRASARANLFLLAGLPPLVLAGTAGVVGFGGLVALNSLYFYWQSWHYTRQSYGIARAYHRSAGGVERDWLTDAVIYGFPLWGVLQRAYEQHPEFYATTLWSPAVPRALVVVVGAAALGSLAAWTWRHVRSISAGRPRSDGYALFVLSHVVITAVSYLLIADITRGWLFINIWHNAQYLLFVWAINARTFRGGVDPRRPFLSSLCQPEHAVRYALVCLALSTTFYVALGQATGRAQWEVLPWVLVCHQAVNFHHYLVDMVIWRSRRKA